MKHLSRTIGELERWHGLLNRELFRGRLSEKAVITVLPSPRGARGPRGRRPRLKLLGWHCGSRWQNGKARLDEINVVAESLKRPVELILETLLHEMCHQHNAERQVQDVSAGTQYHNSHFKAAAEAAGLVCEYDKRVGWGFTKLGFKALATIRKHKPDREAFSIVRLADPDKEKEKKPSKHRKWVCDCGAIRVARGLFRALCLVCDEEFQLVEE